MKYSNLAYHMKSRLHERSITNRKQFGYKRSLPQEVSTSHDAYGVLTKGCAAAKARQSEIKATATFISTSTGMI